MASESNAGISDALLAESRRLIAERGVVRAFSVLPASLGSAFEKIRTLDLPTPPLAVAVDVYGTLLASSKGEVGPGADWGGDPGNAAFPSDMADRLRRIVAEDHARSRERGVPYPEVDAPSVFSRALGVDRAEGARACVAWECAANPCSAMPGAIEFLASCRARGLPLGIVSNAQFYTRLFLEETFGVSLFQDSASEALPDSSLGFDPELILWSFESGRAKPDPWMFEELARRLGARGIPPDRILYVGNDALNDCAAAGEAGLMTALFGGDVRSFKGRLDDPRASARPPSTLVLSWEELSSLLFPHAFSV